MVRPCRLSCELSNLCCIVPSSYGQQQPDLRKIDVPGKLAKFRGYFNIARHYKWALEHVFMVEKHKAVIVVEGTMYSNFFIYSYHWHRSMFDFTVTCWC